MLNARRISLIGFCTAALISGCSGNSSSQSSNVQIDQVRGYVGAGNASQVSLQAVAISNQGQPETGQNELGKEVYVGHKTVSAETGFYQLAIEDDKIGFPTVVIASSRDGDARMICEVVAGCDDVAYGAKIVLDTGFEYRALVTDAAADMIINVNWLTHVANAYAYTSFIDTTDDGVDNPTTPKPGIYSRYSIDVANKRTSQIFNVPDIISVQPIAPSKIFEQTELPLALQEQGILYGAILASIQQIKPADISLMSFLNNIIREVNNQQGQWLKKTPDGSSLVSLEDIYRGAEQVLSDNIAYHNTLGRIVPAIADSVVTELQRRQAALSGAEGEYTSVPVPELISSAQREIDNIENAKWFIEDLNKRLINFDGSDPNTCTGADTDAADCVPSFIDTEYMRHVTRYGQDMKAGLDQAAPDLYLAFAVIRDAIDYYASELIGAPDLSNPLAQSGRVTIEEIVLPENSGILDDTNPDTDGDGEPNISKKLKLTSGDETLYLSFKGDRGTPREPDQGEFHLFRINIEGKLVENGRTFSFEVGNEPSGAQAKPYIEVEYTSSLETPVPFSQEEPLTYQLVWPVVNTRVSGTETDYDLTQYFGAELVGISDQVMANSEFRYNAKSISYRLLSEGPLIAQKENNGTTTDLRDAAEGVVTLSSSGWSLYYPENKWPDIEDYLTFRPGFDVTSQQSAVFRYFAGTEMIGEPAQQVNYIDLQSLSDAGNVLSGTRYRMFPSSEHDNQFGMQACELDSTVADSPVVSDCEVVVTRLQDIPSGQSELQLEQLAQKLLTDVYYVENRGHFSPRFIVNAVQNVAPLTRNQWRTINGLIVRITEDLFRYQAGSETLNNSTVAYLDVVRLAEGGNILAGERNRVIPISGEVEKFNLQRCALTETPSGSWTVLSENNCDTPTEVAGQPTINSLATAILQTPYNIPARGAYRVRLPYQPVVRLKDDDSGDYEEVAEALPLDESQAVILDGQLVLPVSLGIDTMTLRLGAELYNRDAGQEEEAIGPLIADVKMKVLADDVFDIAVTFGYKYDYLVDVVPTGLEAQSLYVAYQAGFGDPEEITEPEELGSLLIFRGGVTLAGSDAAESIGLYASSEAEYAITEENSGQTACAVVNRDLNVSRCDAVAYVGYKGSLLGVVREERDGVFVVRFINGEFVILGG